MPGIVVGIDGSANSARALDWALREAGLRHLPLTVLAVHEVAASFWTGNPMTMPEDAPEVEKVRKAASDAVNKAADRVGGPQPESVTVRAVAGIPASELIEASKDADMLVVGSRGGGGFARLLLGSVSNHVVHHAECPVVVVPHER